MRDSKRALPQRRKLAGKQSDPKQGAEWVGARVLAPMLFQEENPQRAPQRGELLIWLELPSELIVFSEVIDPNVPTSLSDALLRAFEKPTRGAARRPAQIRVADAESAASIRNVVPDIPVRAGPTPEIDALVDRLMADLIADGPPGSYFEEGRISKESVEKLFRAAAALYATSPWDVAADSQVLRLDIPALGVAGACVSILGTAGESYGVLILPSLASFDALARSAERRMTRSGKLDLGTNILSLSFEAAQALPPSMRREIMQHGWPVAGPLAYPRVEHRERDGLLRPLSERDVQIATACASALAQFVARHRAIFTEDEPEQVCATYADSGFDVRLTAPYELDDTVAQLHAGSAPYQRPEPKISRNDPCPCGSRLKYKKCCIDGAAARPSPASQPASARALEDGLVPELMRFQRQRYGDAWAMAARDFQSPDSSVQLFAPWLLYEFHIDGRTLVDRFLDERGASLSIDQRAFLQAQQRSWLSIWEVLDVEPGEQVTVRDLLSGEVRTVHEKSGSRCVNKRDVVLARVVDYGGASIFCGMHPRLRPRAALRA